MVKVANDPVLAEGDLPALSQPAAPEVPEVSGISLRLIAGLAATAHGRVHADADVDADADATRLDVTVDSTTPLRSALRDARAGARLFHRLVLADAAALADHAGRAGMADSPDLLPDVVAILERAGASGLVVSGLTGGALATLV